MLDCPFDPNRAPTILPRPAWREEANCAQNRRQLKRSYAFEWLSLAVSPRCIGPAQSDADPWAWCLQSSPIQVRPSRPLPCICRKPSQAVRQWDGTGSCHRSSQHFMLEETQYCVNSGGQRHQLGRLKPC